MILQAQFGIFESFAKYGVLGLSVLGLGYLCWTFINRLMKSEDDFKNRVRELEEEIREDLDKTIKETKEASNSLKDSIMMFFGSKKR